MRHKLKILSHWSDFNSFPCVFKCLFKWLLWVYRFGHTEQACGFWPVWITKWPFKCSLLTKAFPQTLQECALSPVCCLMCTVRWELVTNLWNKIEYKRDAWNYKETSYLLPQMLQTNGRSFRWNLMCIFRFPLCAKPLSHMEHL